MSMPRGVRGSLPFQSLAALCGLASLGAAAPAMAVPAQVPYLGEVRAAGGGVFEGEVEVTVSLYAAVTGGDALWSEDHGLVPIQGGLLSVVLGELDPEGLGLLIDGGAPLYLQFTLDGAPMLPRQRLLSVPYARLAANASLLQGHPAGDFVQQDAQGNVAADGHLDLAGGLRVGGVPVIDSSGAWVGPGGNAGLSVSAEPPGDNCAAGGARLQVGDDEPVYVCNGTGGGGSEGMLATGGEVSTFVGDGTNGGLGVTYRVHSFTSSGSFEVLSTDGITPIEYLIVGGGGAGRNHSWSGSTATGGGGGGGGGVVTNVGGASITVGPQSYPVVVGAGGLASGTDTTSRGGDSSAFGITAYGGGAGSSRTRQGSPGASGGGGGYDFTSGYAGTPLQGHAGGSASTLAPAYGGGGGGGAGGPGGSGTSSAGGTGGAGTSSSISGAPIGYGGGGGGALGNTSTGAAGAASEGGGQGGSNSASGQPGAPTRGGGGGGAASEVGGSGQGGNGGAGVVIIRYPVPG